MNSGFALFLAFGIGVVAGLRSMTSPATVAWAAHLGWISVSGSRLAFMRSASTVGIFTLGALAEFVAEWLNRAFQQQDSGMRNVKIDPLLMCLHQDPRYADLLKHMRLPA